MASRPILDPPRFFDDVLAPYVRCALEASSGEAAHFGGGCGHEYSVAYAAYRGWGVDAEATRAALARRMGTVRLGDLPWPPRPQYVAQLRAEGRHPDQLEQAAAQVMGAR